MAVNTVQKLYTKRVSLYHRFFIDFLGWGRKLKRFFKPSDYLHANTKILDAGCGTGIVTRVLYAIAKEKGYDNIIFHAFDLTQAPLNTFQDWIHKNGAKHITLKQADVLDIKSDSDWKDYDLIVTAGMLEYLPPEKMRQALNNFKQHLKANGRLLIFITRRSLITKLLVELWWKANIYHEKEIKKIFRDIGFREVKFMSMATKYFDSTIVVDALK